MTRSYLFFILVFLMSSIVSFSQKTYTIDFDDSYGANGTKETTTENYFSTITGGEVFRTTTIWNDSAGTKKKSTLVVVFAGSKNKDSIVVLYAPNGEQTYVLHCTYDSTGKRTAFDESVFRDGKYISNWGWYVDRGMLHEHELDPVNNKVIYLPAKPYKESEEDELPELHLSSPSNSQSSKKPLTGESGVQYQIQGFGGVSFVNACKTGTVGGDVAVLFPLGNRIHIGAMAGFQWINESIVSKIGGGTAPSTFINTSVGFKNGNFGGVCDFRCADFHFGIQLGATVNSETITHEEGFIGNGTPTGGPAGKTVTGTETEHKIEVGPFFGGYISHSIFSPKVKLFLGFNYFHPKKFGSSDAGIDVSGIMSGVGGLALSFANGKVVTSGH